jgi:hyperosmotically inducible protein
MQPSSTSTVTTTVVLGRALPLFSTLILYEYPGGFMRSLVQTVACLLILQGGSAVLAKAPKADNTAQNHGALQKDAVTAEKQGNSDGEVKVTAQIRKSIMSEKGLSVDAQNVKIVYENSGLIILRGPVDSTAEKTQVGALAKACAGVTTVKNELTVAEKAH